ncbi:hypothetical protein BKA69DRAFT_1123222 [Paraphysoderma sedebokerense]|nr:hypothetical protein BKA69DRAFT_1123222 [Paraphysoderma sedebokerense]
MEPVVPFCNNSDPTSFGTCVEFWQNNGGAYQWYSIHLVALFVIIMSMCGSAYIVYLTLKKWQYASLTTWQKLPMFISFTDLLFGFFHGLDHLISLGRQRVMEGGVCQFFGFGTIYAMNLPAFWVTAVAFNVWATIILKRQYIGTVRQDIILHGLCWGFPFIYGLFGFIAGDYGQEPMWCGAHRRTWVWNSVFVIIAMVLNAYFYTHLTVYLFKIAKSRADVKREIGVVTLAAPKSKNAATLSTATLNKVRSNNDWGVVGSVEINAEAPRTGTAPRSTDDKFMKIAKQMPIFVLIYLLQWTPYTIYMIWLVFEPTPYLLNLIVVTLTNAGGIANAIAYRQYLSKE